MEFIIFIVNIVVCVVIGAWVYKALDRLGD